MLVRALISMLVIHLLCLLVFFTGASWIAFSVFLFSFVIRIFGITAGYHRYFSHKSYKTTRWFQFVLAFLGASAMQNGPLWWASKHRIHHQYADKKGDVHSPIANTFWHAHIGWLFKTKYLETDLSNVKDLTQYKELVLLEKFGIVPTIIFGFLIFVLGLYLQFFHPYLQTDFLQIFIWGYILSTVAIYHAMFSLNSLAHLFGSRRYDTNDSSRNNLFVAFVTLGEGWHNNHHYYPASERQGFVWWEIDITHILLKILSFFGIVWNLKEPSRKILDMRS